MEVQRGLNLEEYQHSEVGWKRNQLGRQAGQTEENQENAIIEVKRKENFKEGESSQL